MCEHAVLEVVRVRDSQRGDRVAVVVVGVGAQAIIGVVRVRIAALKRRDGRGQRLAVADWVVGISLRPVVFRWVSRDRLRHQRVIIVIPVANAESA